MSPNDPPPETALGGLEHRVYDWRSVQDREDGIYGEVVRIDDDRADPRWYAPYTVVVRNEGKETRVALAPSWFLEQQESTIKMGDVIEVTPHGHPDGGSIVMAATVRKKGGKKVRLRSPQGEPLWPSSSGGGPGAGARDGG